MHISYMHQWFLLDARKRSHSIILYVKQKEKKNINFIWFVIEISSFTFNT